MNEGVERLRVAGVADAVAVDVGLLRRSAVAVIGRARGLKTVGQSSVASGTPSPSSRPRRSRFGYVSRYGTQSARPSASAPWQKKSG